tara:strand:+ start:9 stop:581 length:573 start_codon:yes stop_codon:yes gene_type:complete
MIQTSFFPQPEKDKPIKMIQIGPSGLQPRKVEEVLPDHNILLDTYMIYPTGGYHPFYGVPNTFPRYQLPIWPYVKRIKYSRNFKNQHQLKSDFGKQYGYPRQTLVTNIISKEHNDGNRYDILMHRIVALAWIPNPDNKPYVMHINDDKTNYLIENLKWGTPSENNKGIGKRPDTMEQKYQNLVIQGTIKG